MKRNGLADHLRHLHSVGVAMVPFPGAKLLYMKVPRTGGTSVHHELIKKHKAVSAQEWVDTISDSELEEYIIFSFVRNPWDRLLSVAKYFHYKPKHILWEQIKNREISENAKRHKLPSSLFTHKDGERFVDLLFRFENLQEHFNILCDLIGMKKVKLRHLSKSRLNSEYRSQYNEGGRLDRGVREFYKDDIKLLGYEF